MNFLTINIYENIFIFEGVWLLSTGLNSGVSKVIGQSVWRHKLLTEKSLNCTVIGLTSWSCLSEETRDALRRQVNIYNKISYIIILL